MRREEEIRYMSERAKAILDREMPKQEFMYKPDVGLARIWGGILCPRMGAWKRKHRA